MAFQPDIFINTPAGRVMVVDAKVDVHDFRSTEEALKRYMVDMQYRFGLLVTPEKVRVYRDSYSSLSPASVQRVEEFDGTRLWRQSPPPRGPEFEAFVQQWIENLVDFPTDSLPPQFKDIVQVYVLPALAAGEVRAAHPR